MAYIATFNILIEAYALEDDDAPLWALIQVSPSFLQEVKTKAKLVNEHDLLTVVARLTTSVEWESQNELRIEGGTLLVTDDGFQIEAFPKYAGYPVYTLEIGIATLEKLADGKLPGKEAGVAARKIANGIAVASDEAMLDAIVEDYQAYAEA